LPMKSTRISDGLLRALDCVLVVTDHSPVSYQMLADHAPLVVDTRGVMRGFGGPARVVGLSNHGAIKADAPLALEWVG
jgi:UDP-N-acetyl-D-glucosamine dehydrogenase